MKLKTSKSIGNQEYCGELFMIYLKSIYINIHKAIEESSVINNQYRISITW